MARKSKAELKKIDLYQVVQYRSVVAPHWQWWALLAGFLGLIATPAVWQGYYERSQQKDIQVLHLPVDMVATPLQHSARMRGALDSLSQGLGTALQQRSQGLRLLNLQIHPNRHHSLDSSAAHLVPWRALDSLLQIQEEDSTSAGVRPAIAALATELRTTVPNGGSGALAHISRAVFSHTLFSRPYLRAWEKEMEETSRLALAVRPWMQFSLYSLFNDMGEKALPGQNGWAFYRPGVEFLVRPWVTDPRSRVVDFNDRALDANPLAAITKFRDQLKARDIELLVVIVPGKASIYPELLVPGLNVGDATGTAPHWGHGEAFLDSLESAGVATVNLYAALRQERAADSAAGDSVYLRTDTHWRPRGAARAARETAHALRTRFGELMGEDSVEYVRDTITVARTGDVVEMTRMPLFAVRDASLAFPTEAVLCTPVYEVQRDSTGAENGRRLYQDDMRGSDILILGDSFSRIYQTDAPRGAGWIATLAMELGRPLASIVSDGGASTLVRETLARRPGVLRGKKLVIWEFVERDFRFGAQGWKDVDL